MAHRTTILSAAAISIVAVISMASAAFAWHPEGVITKQVQNITKGGALADADSVDTAVSAEPGDTLRYVITIKNNGEPHEAGYNDMAETVMTDTLPEGVELETTPSTRALNETIGLVKPGESVTKEYTVKVTASTDTTLLNTACFTGDSTINDNPQEGCDDAYVTVTVPEETPVTPITPETPKETTPATEMPKELPNTGPEGAAISSALAIGALWYGIHRFVASKRALSKIDA